MWACILYDYEWCMSSMKLIDVTTRVTANDVSKKKEYKVKCGLLDLEVFIKNSILWNSTKKSTLHL